MILHKYTCSQAELYTICNAAWTSCLQYLDRFTAVRPKYNKTFIEARKAEVLVVAKMPDYSRRSSGQEKLRLELKALADLGVSKWRLLQLYISEVWSGAEEKNKLKSAGQGSYRSAMQYNWKACYTLLVSGEEFLAENGELLLAHDNMPPGFQAEFAKISQAFHGALEKFNQAVQMATVKTDEKIAANNQLHADMMKMLKIGAEIFRKEPTIRSLFVFEEILNKISGPGVAGIKGRVSNTSVPVSTMLDLSLVLKETGDEAYIEETGAYRFSQLAAGTYTVIVSAIGHKEQVIPNVVVNTGVHTTLDIVLEKLDLA